MAIAPTALLRLGMGFSWLSKKNGAVEREQTIRQSTMPGLYGICAAGKRIKRSREDRIQRAATAFVPRATAGDLSFRFSHTYVSCSTAGAPMRTHRFGRQINLPPTPPPHSTSNIRNIDTPDMTP